MGPKNSEPMKKSPPTADLAELGSIATSRLQKYYFEVALLAGPTDQPRTTRCLQQCSHEALWYSGGEEGEQDMCEPGQPAGGWKPGS